jgi:cell division protein FtsL
MMNDWSVGVESRNYRIAHRPDSRSLADLLASMLCLLIIAGALTGYVWTRCRIVALGYEVQKCKDIEQTLARRESILILEEETLKSPDRIDRIARNELAMEPLGPYQRIAARFSEIDAHPATLALVNTPPASVPPRRSSANN